MSDEKKKETKKKVSNNVVLSAVGRRKTAIATVKLIKGDGDSKINGRNVEDYCTVDEYKARMMLPFLTTNTLGKFHFTAKVSGGGIAGQADAIRLGLARNLAKFDEEYHKILSQASLLTRDPREKERKKIFFVRARKKPQYSKR